MSGQKPNNIAKEAAFQLVAGGAAGCVEVSIMHPLDLVKTRFQIQSMPIKGMESQHYNGIADCMKKMYRSEGLLSFWKGILPPILAETPKRAWKFFTFAQFQTMLKPLNSGGPDAKTTPLIFSLAGLGSGVTEAILVNPFEVVKVKMQSSRAHTSEAPKTFSVAREIIKEDGYFGRKGGNGGLLNKGITGTMGRNGVFNMVYFGFYHSVKTHFPAYSDPTAEFARKVLIGFTAGTLACFVNIPFDVAKSRIQGPQPVGGIMYKGTFRSIFRVYREEGFKALYKGIVPKILRLGPGGAIMLLVNEYVFEYLCQRFPN